MDINRELEGLVNYELKKHQVKGVLWQRKRRARINGFTMGLGKTYTSIAVSLLDGGNSLIVVPAYLRQNWVKEIEKLLVKPEIDVVEKLPAKNRAKFTIVSYTSFNKAEGAFPDINNLILDECQYVKNPSAIRTKDIAKFIRAYRPERFMPMSGTAIKNGVPEWWSVLRLIWQYGEFPEFNRFSKSKWLFSDTFCNRKYTFRDKFKFVGVRNAEALSALIKPVYLRMRSRDAVDLPETVNMEIMIGDRSPLDRQLKEAWSKYLKGNKDDAFATIKAKSALGKVQASIEKCMSIVESGEQVLIYTDHIEAARALKEKIPHSGMIIGSVTTRERDKIVERFIDGDLKVLIGTYGAMSTGYNFTNCHHMISNDIPWVPGDLSQARKRINRLGQTERCFYYVMLMSQVDKKIYETVIEKLKTLNVALNI